MIIFPILFAIYPALFLVSNNYGSVSFGAVALISGAAVVLALTLWFMLYWLFKDKEKSAFLTAIVLIFFFSYGHFSAVVTKLDVFGFSFVRNRYRATLYLFIMVVSLILGIKAYSRLKGIGSILNLVSVFLILLVGTTIGWQAMSGPKIAVNEPSLLSGMTAAVDHPDIYYIIVDGYARPDMIKEIYGSYYNGLNESLARRGFYIAKGSTCNYPMTDLSLFSSLNMQYIRSKNEFDAQNNKENRLETFLQSNGYTIYDLENGMVYGKNDRRIMTSHSTTSFLMLLLNTTMVDMIAHRLSLYASYVRRNVLDEFYLAEMIAGYSGPKYVFVHIPSPHPPYVFDREGKPARAAALSVVGDVWKTSWDDEPAYLDQWLYISGQTDKLVGSILSQAKTPPVIIVQSDHGPQFSDEKNDFYRKRMSILNAFYVPAGIKKQLYSSITPVNSFRLILDYYFGEGLKLLPDANYFSTMEKRFELKEVTTKVRAN